MLPKKLGPPRVTNTLPASYPARPPRQRVHNERSSRHQRQDNAISTTTHTDPLRNTLDQIEKEHDGLPILTELRTSVPAAVLPKQYVRSCTGIVRTSVVD